MNELTDRNVATVVGWTGRAVVGERSAESSVAFVVCNSVKGRKGTPLTLVCPETKDLLLQASLLKNYFKDVTRLFALETSSTPLITYVNN